MLHYQFKEPLLCHLCLKWFVLLTLTLLIVHLLLNQPLRCSYLTFFQPISTKEPVLTILPVIFSNHLSLFDDFDPSTQFPPQVKQFYDLGHSLILTRIAFKHSQACFIIFPFQSNWSLIVICLAQDVIFGSLFLSVSRFELTCLLD